MLLGPKPGAVKRNLIRGRYRIIAKDLTGLWKLSFVVAYEDRLPELEIS